VKCKTKKREDAQFDDRAYLRDYATATLCTVLLCALYYDVRMGNCTDDDLHKSDTHVSYR
jgi:hypothetical protein